MTRLVVVGVLLQGFLGTIPLECQSESQAPTGAPSTPDTAHVPTEEYNQPCSYAASPDTPDLSKDDIGYDWDHHEHCARLEWDGHVEFKPSHLARMRFDDGLAEVAVSGLGWFWVRPSGESLHVVTFDNSPDPWSEDLVRGRRDGQIVYFTRSFEEATGQRYDWGWPFENGRALVCRGCFKEDPDSEHPSIVGGTWWYIGPAGNEIRQEDLSDGESARLERLSESGAGRYR